LKNESRLPASVDAGGDIALRDRFGDIRFRKPVVYQEDADGHREYRDAGYVLNARVHQSTISFRVGNYDHSKPLVIDPAITYSTYLGGATD